MFQSGHGASPVTEITVPDIVTIAERQRKMKKKFYTAKDLKEKMQKALDALEKAELPDGAKVIIPFNKNELLDTIDIFKRVESIQCPHCFKWLFDGRKYHAMHYCSACGAVLINVREWTEGEEDEQTDA